MTVKAYIAILAERYGVKLRLNTRGILVVDKRKLPITVVMAMAGYRAQLKRVLATDVDEALDLTQSRGELMALGFQELPDVDGAPLVHPDGDEVGLEILIGVLGPNEARAAAQARERRAARERQALSGDGRAIRVNDHTIIQRRGSIDWK